LRLRLSAPFNKITKAISVSCEVAFDFVGLAFAVSCILYRYSFTLSPMIFFFAPALTPEAF
jgi:hypothetical protein